MIVEMLRKLDLGEGCNVVSQSRRSRSLVKRSSDARRADLTSVVAKSPQANSCHFDSPHAHVNLGI